MMHDEFATAFQNVAARQLPPAPHDARYITWETLRRDQWRTRVLAFFSLLFWLIGAAGMLLLIYGLNQFIIFVRIADWPTATGVTPATHTAVVSMTPWEHQMLRGTSLIHHSLPYIAGSVVSLLLAALFTVLLIFSSRRATLSRINLSLVQISDELRLLRAARTST